MDEFSHLLTVDYGGIHDRTSDISDADSDTPSSSAAGSAPRKHSKHHRIFRHQKATSSSSMSHTSCDGDGDDPSVDAGHSNVRGGAGSSSSSSGTTGTANRLQDKVVAKLLHQILPSDYDLEKMEKYAEARRDKDRPGLSMTLMSGNFRRFNSRIGIVFVFQHQLYRLLAWKSPTHTLSFLAVYSFICLDPQLLAILPVVMVLVFIMVPAFIARHPPSPATVSGRIEPYVAHGGAIAPPPEVKIVSEMSKDFFRNLRDLQNTMADFSEAHDQIIATIGPPTNFSDEQISSGVFQALFALCILLFLTAYVIPWGIVLFLIGWLVVGCLHPTVQNYLLSTHDTKFMEKEKQALLAFEEWVRKDIILDEEPESREVEIFELQRRTSSGEWEPWIFSSKPYVPLSPARIAHQRPQGTRFFEDVQPPRGWEFKDKKWTLDLGSSIWVQERYITGVEVEEEEERWVYDYVVVSGQPAERGEWRRRRWVRNVVRKKYQRREGE